MRRREDGDGAQEEIGVEGQTFVVFRRVKADTYDYRASLVVAIQNYLGESEAARKNSAMPGYMSIGMSCTWETSRLRHQALVTDDLALSSHGAGLVLPAALPASPGSGRGCVRHSKRTNERGGRKGLARRGRRHDDRARPLDSLTPERSPASGADVYHTKYVSIIPTTRYEDPFYNRNRTIHTMGMRSLFCRA